MVPQVLLHWATLVRCTDELTESCGCLQLVEKIALISAFLQRNPCFDRSMEQQGMKQTDTHTLQWRGPTVQISLHSDKQAQTYVYDHINYRKKYHLLIFPSIIYQTMLLWVPVILIQSVKQVQAEFTIIQRETETDVVLTCLTCPLLDSLSFIICHLIGSLKHLSVIWCNFF